MRRLNTLADRMLERIVPSRTASAACSGYFYRCYPGSGYFRCTYNANCTYNCVKIGSVCPV